MSGNYVERAHRELEQRLPDCSPTLLRFYTLLLLTRGAETRRADVHDAWAAWKSLFAPEHASLVPFRGLPEKEQDAAELYRSAIVQAAQEIAVRRELSRGAG